MNIIIKFFSLFNSISLRNKFRNFSILVNIYSYQRYLKKKLLSCGSNIRLYNPLSITGLNYISIGDNVKIGNGVRLEAISYHNSVRFNPKIIISNNVSFGNNCHIGCVNQIEILENVLIGSNVLIIDHNHGNNHKDELIKAPNDRILYSKGPIKICENVWIGDNVIILPGVTIGANSIIGANSVVTHDVPNNSIVCGISANVIKEIE